jgi:ParB family chromosome partitioning protein
MPSSPITARPASSLLTIPVHALSPAPSGQARQHFDAATLQNLAASVKRSGIREPIIVTPHESESGRYRIVAGERRWRAAQLAGLAEIPCLVDERLADPKQRLLAQAEENLHREDLNVVEEAAVLVHLMEAFSLGAQEAGALIGRSYQQARRLIQIHNAPQPIRDAIVQGHVDARAALELVRIHNKLAQDPRPDGKRRAAAQLDELVDRVVNERWTIRRLEHYARKEVDGADEAKSQQSPGPAVRAPAAAAQRAAVSRSEAVAKPAGAPPYRRDATGVLINAGRIARNQISPEEREELINILEELLMAVRRATCEQPARSVSPRGERHGNADP